MEFITNLFSNDKVLSGLFANLDLIKLSYTFGGLLFIFSAAKVFYINFGLLEDDKPTWKVFLFNLYLFVMGFCTVKLLSYYQNKVNLILMRSYLH